MLGKVQVRWKNWQIPDGSSEYPLNWNHSITVEGGSTGFMGLRSLGLWATAIAAGAVL